MNSRLNIIYFLLFAVLIIYLSRVYEHVDVFSNNRYNGYYTIINKTYEPNEDKNSDSIAGGIYTLHIENRRYELIITSFYYYTLYNTHNRFYLNSKYCESINVYYTSDE